MLKKIIAQIIIICLIFNFFTCYTSTQIPPANLEDFQEYTITKVIKNNGEIIEFITSKRIPKPVLVNNTIKGALRFGTYPITITIPISEIRMVYLRKLNAGRTIVVIGITAYAAYSLLKTSDSGGLGLFGPKVKS